MGSMFDELFKKRQEEMQRRQQGRDNVESNVSSMQSSKGNLLDFIRRTQEERDRIRSSRANSVANVKRDFLSNGAISKQEVKSVSDDRVINVPKTQDDIDRIVNSMSKVNDNYKDDTLNNIKNFNNLQYNSNQQLNNVNNAKKVSMNDLKNIENTVTAMNLKQEAKNTGDYYNTYKGYADKVIADMGNKIDDATNFSGALSNLGIGVKKRFNKYCW